MNAQQRDSCGVACEQSTNHESQIINHKSPNSHLLIIAYGNTLRRDDGAGLALAEKMEPLLCDQGFQVDLITVQQLTPELAVEIADPTLDAVCFFDTAVDAHPAAIQMQRIVMPQAAPVLGHHLDSAVLLLYATQLYGVCPPTWLITIPGSDFTLGEGFSPTTADHLADVAPLVEKLGQLITKKPL